MDTITIEVSYQKTFLVDGSVMRGSIFFIDKEVAMKYIEAEATNFNLNLIKTPANKFRDFEVFLAISDIMEIKYFVDWGGIDIYETEKDFPKPTPKVWFKKNPKWVEEQND